MFPNSLRVFPRLFKVDFCGNFRDTVFISSKSLIVRNSSCDSEGKSGGKSTEDSFFSSITQRNKTTPKNKITVVGVGNVGMACAVSCLTYGITTDLCLYDVDVKKATGEAMDLQHGSLFLGGARVQAASDVSETANSRIIIITAGARQKGEVKRPQLMSQNVDIMKACVPDLVKHSPDCIILLVTNPVDALCYALWKISGLPVTKVIGSGTNLDSSRFRYLISERLNINVKSTHGYIIGEHGDTSVPVWSGVNIAGVPLRTHLPKAGEDEDPENWNVLHKKTVAAAYDVIKLKGYTSWAVGLSVGQLSEAFMKNTLRIYCVTTNLKGHYNIEDDVFASVPCILGEGGVLALINLKLTELELQLLHKSVDAIRSIQNNVKI